jgi:hypothetical protein
MREHLRDTFPMPQWSLYLLLAALLLHAAGNGEWSLFAAVAVGIVVGVVWAFWGALRA